MKLKPMQFIEVRDVEHIKKLRSENECYASEECDIRDFNDGYKFFICGEDSGKSYIDDTGDSREILIKEGYTEVFDTPQKTPKSKVFKNKYYIGERVFLFNDGQILNCEIQSINQEFQYELLKGKFFDEGKFCRKKHQLKQSLFKKENKRHEEEIGRINNL